MISAIVELWIELRNWPIKSESTYLMQNITELT